jgi:hypothetical protein
MFKKSGNKNPGTKFSKIREQKLQNTREQKFKKKLGTKIQKQKL